ncbi:MAG: FAD-binding oxidoreductase, partial [Tissierella sp.]|uniref:FAD-binding oxidoreductase n=1 Tax=Tissierella sp. TaxID=41274 RepID=UPI003F9B2F7E
RAYSIASSPMERDHIELIIGYVPEGIATTYVHKHLKVDDEVTINGPYGDFYYQDNERDMIMVAVGTGVAPILSILKWMKTNNIKRKARFYFGAKTEEDLFFLDYFKELEETLYDFKFIPCLSRVTEEDGWSGFCGRVNNAIDEFVEGGENKEAYLCGGDRMIDSVVKALTNKNVDEELIYYDKFD